MINRYTTLERVLIYLGLTLLLVFLLAPFFEAILVSLRPMDQLFNVPYKFFTPNMSIDAYFTMWQSQPLLMRYILNSLFIASAVCIIALSCVIPAAYAFARYNFPFRNATLGTMLAINMVGPAVLIIPLYKVMLYLGLLNSYWSMILPGVTFVIPTGIFLMRSYFVAVPKEFEEAAFVDGASLFYTMRRVVLPLAAPGIAVVAIMTFIASYAQQFLFALTFNSNSNLQPLSVGLFGYFGREIVIWNELMAAALVGVMPVLVLYLFLQRYIVAGLTAGSVK